MLPLPSLDHLRAFEAAARHLSFKQAANELSVTPAAIGQRIRSLEAHLKIKLFTRKTRQVILTHDGQELLSAVSTGLLEIQRAIAQIQARQNTNVITISTTNSFTECCLLPLLPEFSTLHPDYDVRIVSTDEQLDFDRDNVDLAIRFGRGDYENARSIKLTENKYIPVCSPEYLLNTQLKKPEKLNSYVLIDTEWRVHQSAIPTWEKWFNMCNVSLRTSAKRLSVSIEAHAIRAAVSGQGVALVNQLFVEQDLRQGVLIPVFEDPYPLTSEFDFYLVWPDRDESSQVNNFMKWAKATFS